MRDLKGKISKILLEVGEHPKIDEAIVKYTNQVLALIKKHEREIIGKFEHRIHKLRAMIPLTGGMSARNEAKDILNLLAKLKEVEK